MKHAELCPVCKGAGMIYPDNPAHPNWRGSMAITLEPVPCHGCRGKGWVEVEGESITIPSVWTEPNPAPSYTITTWPPNANGDDWLIITPEAK